MSNYRNDPAIFQKAFAALSNPHRLALFQRLTTCCAPGTSCSIEEVTRISVGVLSDELSIAQSTVSHHLRTLRDAGLVRTERRGRRVECWVDPTVLLHLADFFLAPLNDVGVGAESVAGTPAPNESSTAGDVAISPAS